MAPSARDHRGSTQRVDLERNPVKNLPRGENDQRCSIALPNTAAGYWQVCLLYQNLPLSAPRPRKKKVLTYWHIASMIVLAQENGGAEDDGSHSASTRGKRRQVAPVRMAWRVRHDLLVRAGRRDVPSL